MTNFVVSKDRPSGWKFSGRLMGTVAVAAGMGAAVSLPQAAWAQATALEEVVVTATRRAESIQDVPISISAYNAEFLESSGVTDIRDVSLYSPNFTIGNSSQLSNNRIAIRGVGSVGNSGIEPSVGVFVDGIYYPKPGSVIGSLVDIQSFEVLRGPQGTLFGRNTPVGALNISTKDPTLGETSGNIQLGFGSFGASSVGGAVNIPLGENLAVRLSGKYSDRDGYGDNLLTGEEYGAREDTNFRAKFLYQPSDVFSAKLTIDSGDIDSEGSTIEFLNGTESPVFLGTLAALAGPAATQILTEDAHDHDIYQDHRDDLQDEQSGVALDMSWDLASGHVIRSITGARSWEAKYFESAIRLPIQLFPRKTDYDNETFSQEFHFLSPTDGDFSYIVGGFYYEEDYYISQDFDLGAQFCIPVVAGLAGLPAGLGCAAFPQIDASDGEFDQDLESLAVFGQATWDISDSTSFTFGGRYSADDKTANFSNAVNNPFVIALAVRDVETQSNLDIEEFGYDSSQFTYFLNLSHNLNDDVMLFLTTSSGYKSGGFNTDGTFPALTRAQRIFGPEVTTSYELGIKSTLLDGAMTLNATAYLMDIEGFQDRAFDGISFITRNVGELRQQGFEADMNWNLTDSFRIIAGLSYLDSEFKDYTNASPLPGGPVQNLTGASAHFSPDWQGSLVADYTTEVGLLGGSLLFLRGELQHVGEQNIGGNTNQNPQSIQEAYTLYNAAIGLRAADDKWTIALRGKNLGDEGYCMTIFDQPFGAQLGGLNPVTNTIPQRCAVAAPRTYGVEFNYNF